MIYILFILMFSYGSGWHVTTTEFFEESACTDAIKIFDEHKKEHNFQYEAWCVKKGYQT